MRSLALLVATLLLLPAAVGAQTRDENWSRCGDPNGNPDLVIGACTALIQSGRESTADLATAFYNRGTSRGRKSENDKALEDFDQAIKLAPTYAKAFNNRCVVKAATGRGQEALADCDASLRIRPNDAGTLASRGIAYLALKNYDAALSTYETALKADAKSAYALFGRGVAKRRKGDIAGGDADIAAAKAIKADIADQMAKYGVRP
jgi:tetratricopeptide (TPR) repeat protein